MADARDYARHRDRARAAITRMQQAETAAREARADRDAEVLAMLATPGATLGSVATDLGLSKSLVAVIHRTGRAVDDAVAARTHPTEHPPDP